MNTWKDVNPVGYAVSKEAMNAWLSKRLEELQLENLKQLSENIKNGKKLQKGV